MYFVSLNKLTIPLRPFGGLYLSPLWLLFRHSGCMFGGCVAKIFKLIKMKHISQSLQVKQGEDVLLLHLKFTCVAHALTIMMSLKIFATQST